VSVTSPDQAWAEFHQANRPGTPDPMYATRFTPDQMRAGHLAHHFARKYGKPVSGEVMALERAYNAWRHRVQRENRRQPA
jgi:hypothetical protein